MPQNTIQKADTLLAQAIFLTQKKGGEEEAVSFFEQAAQIYAHYKCWTAYAETQEKRAKLLLDKLAYSEIIALIPPILKKVSFANYPQSQAVKNLHIHLAAAYYHKGFFEKAQVLYQTILDALITIHGEFHADIGSMYSSIGNCQYNLGYLETALAHYKKGLHIRQKILDPDHPKLAFSYSSLGRCYYQKRDYEIALMYHRKSLYIREQHYGNHHLMPTYSLIDIASCFLSLNDPNKAIKFYKQALNIRLQLYGEKHPILEICYFNLGLIFKRKQGFLQALHYFKKVVVLQQQVFGEIHEAIAKAYAYIGRCYDDLKEYEQAAFFLKKALAIRQQIFNPHHEKVASVYDYLGRHFMLKKEFQAAVEHFQQAMISLCPTFKPKTIFENPILKSCSSGERTTKVLSGKAAAFEKLFFKKQDPTYLHAAFEAQRLVVKMIDKERVEHQAESAKFLFANEIYKRFEKALQTAFAFAQHIPTQKELALQTAFTFFEKSKAIALLSSMKEAEAKNVAKIPPHLLKKEQQLKQELSRLAHTIALEKQKVEANETLNEQQKKRIKKLENQQFETHQDYTQLVQELEQTQPVYLQIKHNIATTTLAQVQAQLAPQTTLVAYFMGEEQIYIFEVSAVKRQELGGRRQEVKVKQVEDKEKSDFQVVAANGYALYQVPKPDNLGELLGNFQQAREWMDEIQFAEIGHRLYKLLLVPIFEKNRKSKTENQNLFLLPHAELLYLPFEALVMQKSTETADFHELPYLLKNYNVTYHYSATLWQHGISRQAVTKSLKDSFLGIAPVSFDGSEQKELAVESSEKTGFRSKVFRSTNATESTFDSLPSTEVEVKAVYDLFQKKQKEAKALLYGAASKKNLRQFAPTHKYILISTHGFIQGGNVQLSGIHLAKPVKRQEVKSHSEQSATISEKEKTNTPFPQSLNDFQLYTSEAYHLQLNADLVVLSSCESGIGQLHKGEGMVAINRAFIYAGASNIIFSLFEVPDDATGRLMPLLFEYILEGDDYTVALRKAKLVLLQNADFSPQDWAGFVLIGI